MRDFFQRVEEGTLVDIEVSINAFAYSTSYPWLLSVFIKFNASDTQSDAYEEFLELKESLIVALESAVNIVYVGMRIVDGWSEIYFYAEDSKTLDAIVTDIVKSTQYLYESNVVRDTKWDFHHKNLLPTELEECHIQSEKIIEMLVVEGDDLSVEREVEHYISFEMPTQKARFVDALNLDGYSFKDEISSDEFTNAIALVKKQSVTSDSMQSAINVLFKEIKVHQGFYEGWSTTLAKQIPQDEDV